MTLTIESILLLTATCNLKVQEVIGLCFVKLLSPVSGVCAAMKGQRSFGSVSCLQRGHCAFHTMPFWPLTCPQTEEFRNRCCPLLINPSNLCIFRTARHFYFPHLSKLPIPLICDFFPQKFFLLKCLHL